MRTRLITSLALFGLVVAGIVPAKADDFGILDLMRGLAKTRERRASFVEEKHLAALTEPLISRGDLDYWAPAHLVKHTIAPVEERLEVEGSRLTIDRPSEGEHRSLSLDTQPEIKTFVEAIRSTLAGDLPTLREYYDVGFLGSRAQWQLTLVPRSQRARDFLRVVRIEGTDDRLSRVEFSERSGDSSTMTIRSEQP